MLKPRSGLVLSFSSLFLALVASNCTVNSKDTDDDDDDDGNGCVEGRTTSCNCEDGSDGSQECTSRGTWGTCVCEGAGGAGGTGGSSAGKGGWAGKGGSAGTETGYAGEGGYGGWTASSGGAHAGGEGGIVSGGGSPGLCAEPDDGCQACYFGQCCSQLEACLNDEVCVQQFVAMRECSNIVVAQHDASPTEIDDCAPAPNGANHWPGNHTQNMIALVDCMNGGSGWEDASTWPHGTCLECYKHDGPVAGGEGGAGGQASGAGGQPSDGQAGAGPVGGYCDNPEGSCQECYYSQCCTQFEACLNNEQCVNEFSAMRQCSNAVVAANGHATPEEIDACAPNPNGANHWHGNHAAETIALIDCMNGGLGWEDAASWPHGTCLSCYQTE